jgi:hypothetical protein
VQITKVVRAYVEVARLYMETFDENEDILPKDNTRTSVTWKDVKKLQNKVKIQFSAASSLSKDPEKRITQLEQLSQLGLIPKSKLGNYIDMPDISS